MNSLKKIVKNLIPQFLKNKIKKNIDHKEYETWKTTDKKGPSPHIVKQKTIKEYQSKFGISTLIETGTYKGDMVQAQRNVFKKIYSIELSVPLYERAIKRFAEDEKIQILQGDSGYVLPQIIKELDEPAIFWLDGHYSSGETAKGDKECPIFEELNSIFEGKELSHVLLIDDARMFIGKNDYPTIDELEKFIKQGGIDFKMEVLYDIIRVELM